MYISVEQKTIGRTINYIEGQDSLEFVVINDEIDAVVILSPNEPNFSIIINKQMTTVLKAMYAYLQEYYSLGMQNSINNLILNLS